MSEPLPNPFAGWAEKPGDADLAKTLGALKPVWDELVAHVAEAHGADVQVWKSYSVKYGWSMRLLKKKRAIIWLSPATGCFQVLFILGGKAVEAARQCGLPAKVLKALDEAPKYPEGTGLRLVIKSAKDLPAVKKLAAVKAAN